VAVNLDAKGDAKTSVTIQHQRLASSSEVEKQRAFWRERLAALGAVLAGEVSRDAAVPRRPGTIAARPSMPASRDGAAGRKR
jgi:hypothetical protein